MGTLHFARLSVVLGALVAANSNAWSQNNESYLKLSKVIPGDIWERRSGGRPPTPRQQQTAVWTGSEMIVWGGYNGDLTLGDDGRYDPTTSPATEKAGERKSYFEDLPEELQKHLRKQLRAPGDISAVIETPGGFLLYLAKERNEKALAVGSLFLPKRSYEQWLDEQERKL